jgi:hypothetical protein
VREGKADEGEGVDIDCNVRFGWKEVDDFVEMKLMLGCPYEFHLLRKSDWRICTWLLATEVGWRAFVCRLVDVTILVRAGCAQLRDTNEI